MKTIIAGSRTINDYSVVESAINESNFDIKCVVCGMANGVDNLGAKWAMRHDKNIHYCPANWKKYGKSAGFTRNMYMAELADSLIAIWDGKSSGTSHMINTARQKGLQIFIKIVDATTNLT